MELSEIQTLPGNPTNTGKKINLQWRNLTKTWFMKISEKAMAPYCSTLAWKIPWMEEPGGLQSMGSPRVGHDWATSLSLFTFIRWRRKRQPTPVFLPGESQGRGSLVAAVYGVTQSRTWLKWLSSSSIPFWRWTLAHYSLPSGCPTLCLSCVQNIFILP